MDWSTQNLRVTAFVRGFEPIRGLWTALVGTEPEEIIDRPKLGSYSENGQRSDDERLILSWLPGRSQLEVQSAEFPSDLFAVLPTGSGFVHANFLVLAKAWLEKLREHRLTRIAFGAVLLNDQPTREATYSALQALLPDVKLDPKSTDFSYRINRPRNSRVIEGLKLNRISSWQAISLRNVLADNNQPPRAVELAVAARLDLDLSTDGERDEPLPEGQCSNLLDELVREAREIATHGDVK